MTGDRTSSRLDNHWTEAFPHELTLGSGKENSYPVTEHLIPSNAVKPLRDPASLPTTDAIESDTGLIYYEARRTDRLLSAFKEHTAEPAESQQGSTFTDPCRRGVWTETHTVQKADLLFRRAKSETAISDAEVKHQFSFSS